jgi:hypothetical protein
LAVDFGTSWFKTDFRIFFSRREPLIGDLVV